MANDDAIPAFDDIPSFDQMPDSPDAPAPQAANAPLMFDDIPSFDDMQDQSSKPQAESFIPRVARKVANTVAPAAAGYAGAGAGAEVGGAIGTAIFPGPGTLVGGIVGAAAGGMSAAYAAAKAQQAGKEALGLDDSTQLAANAEEHPYEDFAIDLATNAAGMRPDKAASLVTRGAGALLGGGLEAGQEYANEGTIDPAKVAASAATFAALPSTNRFGAALEGAGARVGSKVIPGRPGRSANPAAVPAESEAQASQQPTVEGEAATVQPAPSESGDTVGNPQSRPERSSRVYAKGAEATGVTPDILTSGEFPPDVAAALQENLNSNRVDTAERGQLPGPEQPGDIDASLREAPIQTGFPQASPDQAAAPVAPEAQPAPAAQPTEQVGAPAPNPNAAKKTLTVKPRAPEAVPAPEVHPEAQKVADVRSDVEQPTAAQAEAGNYSKGHPGRLFGREVTIETPKGGVREDTKNTPPKWRVENFPYDYGEFLGTKGADGDRVDVGVVGTGDRHFVIDQRDPATGKFDEHKVMAYAKDPVDAIEHYQRGFNDGSGPDRVGSIKEASEDDLKAWLAKPGKKSAPYDADAFSGDGGQAGATVGPTEGEKPLPKVVTAAVTKMKAAGLPQEAIDRFMNMEPSARMGEASKYVNETASVPARPDRIRTSAPVVEGIKNDAGEPITARDKADAARKSADVKVMNDAYENFKPETPLPTTPEEKAALRKQVENFMEATKAVKYKPALKHEPYLLQRAGKKLLAAKNPSDASWQRFAETLHQLRNGGAADVRVGDRIESDIGLSRRSGDEAVANAEARSAGTNTVEDDMIEALDRARSSEGNFDVPHEEAEAMVEPEPVRNREDIDRLESATEHVDITKPEGVAKLKSETAQLADNLIKTADRKPAKGESEGAASAGKKIDVGSVDKKALLEALERANAKNKKENPGNVRDEELGRFDSKPKGIKDLVDMFGKDENGSLNLKKVHQDYMSTARPQLRRFVKSLNSVFGTRTRNSEFRVDALLAQDISHREREMARKAELLDGKYEQWSKLSPEHQMDFQELLERDAHKSGTINTTRFEHDLRQMGVAAKDAAWMAQDAPVWRDLLDKVFLDDQAHGSEEGYVRGYAPHIFEQPEEAANFILGRIKPLGATWYQKERTFDSIAAARKAGFKLKYSNPIDVLNARLNASINSNAIVDAARRLQQYGYAVPTKEAAAYHKRAWKYEVKLPDGQNWLLAPDAVGLWKNAIESKGLQGDEGPLGSIYRNWMRIKRFIMPIQLGLSLFHFGHILSINATENLDRAFNNWRAGDKFGQAYGEALRNIGRDVFALPFDKLKWISGTTLGDRSRNFEGRQIMKNWAKPDDQLSGWDKALGHMFEEAGTSPYQPHEDVIGAKRSFIDAVNNWKQNPTGVGANLRMIEPAIARGVEKSQEWLFKDYIPGLKTAALARRMVDAVRHDPTLATNDVKRRMVFRELARSNDDRFGEMFYKGLFWNRAVKDAALGSFVSLGWNLGQWRQVAGAGTQGTRALLRKFNGDQRGPIERARQNASNKVSFVAHYAMLTMLAAGGLSWALSGKIPTGLDYIFPRNGESNDDGTPGRLATPFNTREPVMMKAHIDERNSIGAGLAQTMWNKTVLQPVAELLSNKDFYGDHLWDTNAGPVKALLQGADAMLGRLFNPIAITGGTRAYQEGSGAKGMALSLAGFGPAPKYAEENALERRVTHLFREQSLPEARPYEYGPKTGLGHGAVQSTIRLAAGDKTTTEARNIDRKQMEHAKATGDETGRAEAAQRLATEGHLSSRTIAQMQRGDVYTYRFARLPEATQISLARQMSDADFQRYVVRNQNAGIKKQTRGLLLRERSNNQ